MAKKKPPEEDCDPPSFEDSLGELESIVGELEGGKLGLSDALARYEPIGATENGDNRYDDQLGLSISPGKRALQWSFRIQTSSVVEEVTFAESMGELRSV